MDRTTLIKALSKQFYPILREEGFKGSGNTLRRINDPVVHVFNVQGSLSGNRFYLNLGAHLLFLPNPGGVFPTAKTLKEYQCLFHERFDSPPGEGRGWVYGRNMEEMNENIAFIKDHWKIYGQEFFDRYTDYPDDFVALIESYDPSETPIGYLLPFARIAANLGDGVRGELFAQEGLKRCTERSTRFRAELEEFIKSLNRT